jgi:hypothetical protein
VIVLSFTNYFYLFLARISHLGENLPSTTISDARGVVHSGGSGLTIESAVTVKGSIKFEGPVSGVTADVVTRCKDLGAPAKIFEYQCSGGTRYFRHIEPLSASWTADFLNLELQRSQVATVKIMTIGADSAEHFLEDVLVDGKPVSSFITSSALGLKFRKGGKHSIATLEIMRSESGEIHVYADIVHDLVV